MVVTFLLLACTPDAPAPVGDDTAPPAVVALDPLPPTALLTRVSLDLRGVRPSLAEQEQVAAAADPYAAVDALADAWVSDPRFGGMVASLFSDVLLTRQDAYTVSAADFGLPTEAPLMQAIGEAPLRMVARVADEDLPWTEVVTGDWTMAEETIGSVWPVDYPDGATGWQVVRWTDGRPPVGLLATNSLWWRYTTTDSNANRGRANAISRVFLCNDYLQHPITFDRTISLVDEDAVREALTTAPQCVSCHVSLDPLAANLFGFLYRFDYSPYDRSVYHSEREDQWQAVLQVEPGYFGRPSDGLYDLGRLIAADERFPSCAAETFYRGMLQRELTTADDDALVAHRDALIGGGVTMRALFRSLVRDPAYRAGPSDESALPNRKLVTPELLGREVEELTGYRMTVAEWDLLTSDLYGLRLLAGGIDGVNATSAPRVHTPTLLLVQERLAEAAARYAVDSGTSPLFPLVPPTEAGDEATRRAQIVGLALRVIGAEWATDGVEVDALAELWDAATATDGDPRTGWTAVLTALLRDPALVVY